MRFSYKEIEKYIDSPMPSVEDLAKELTDKAFEVEDIESSDGDHLMEIKVLPDRPDCKNPLGMAREISAIFGLDLKSEYKTKEDSKTKINFSTEEINSILGLNLPPEEIIEILERFEIKVERGDKLTALIPGFRSDLNIVEDLADEVGRMHGVENIPVIPLEQVKEKSKADTIYALSNKIRETLLSLGFSEIYGYSLAPKGKVETEKPLAQDKAFLRTNLTDGLKEKLQFNLPNVLFDQEPVKIFEIGTVFPEADKKEVVRLGIAVGYKSAKFKESIQEQFKDWDGKLTSDDTSEILEIDLENLMDVIDKNSSNLSPFINLDVKYEPFSPYPKIVRDIALWVGEGEEVSEVKSVIKQSAQELLSEGPILFDEFKKDNKKSLAFRMAFQSKEKTLTDNEVNEVMEEVQKAISSKGWEVR